MIKKMKICECDVCGKLSTPVYGENWFDVCMHIDENLPEGWEYLAGKKEGMCMCKECAEAFHKARKESEKENAD
jgi:hypothetical protein